MKKAMVYIDGFNLYYGIRSLNKPNLKWLNVQKLAESFLHKGTQLVQVKYFTAMLNGNVEKSNRQKHYLKALKEHTTHLTIVKGHFLIKGFNCRKCNYHNETFEEKQSDVNLSCELLADTYEDCFDIAFVVSGDSDLATPVSKAVTKGKSVIVANPPNRKSQALLRAASNGFSINLRRLRSCTLPQQFTTENGSFTMPEEWQVKVK